MGVNQIITPRWEWRSFGGVFDAIESLMSGPVRTTHEIYVLCESSETNVKIRDHVIEVKELQRTLHGLELWTPVFKAPFPLGQESIRRVFELWPLPPPSMAGAPYAELEFITEVVSEVSGLHIIGLAKTRRQAIVDGCVIESGAVNVAGRIVQTVAVEMEDPDRVRRMVHELKLDQFENVNYVNFLKHVLHLRMRPTAAAPPEGACHEEDSLPLVRPVGALPGDPVAGAASPGDSRR